VRSLLLAVAVTFVLSGCGSSSVVVQGNPVPSPYDGPMDLPIDHRDQAAVVERSGSAGRALECDGDPYDGGGADYDSGLASVQDSAEGALDNLFDEDPVGRLPEDGYRIERADSGQVASDDVRDHNGDEGWGVEAWAACDPAELPAKVTDDLGIEVWRDASGRRAPVSEIESYRGAEHCGWQDITFLLLRSRDHTREYIRDPRGELTDFLHTAYDGSATLPAGATNTGLHRDQRELWLSDTGDAAYLVSRQDAEHVERWPASKEPIRCA
jgi:hypothetical protein